MLEHNYTHEQWENLAGSEKALCIAYSRLNMLIEGHKQESINQYIKRRQQREKQR